MWFRWAREIAGRDRLDFALNISVSCRPAIALYWGSVVSFMADIDITQLEADSLIAMEKRRVDDKVWLFPPTGERLGVALLSPDKRENFMLDVTRATIRLTKATYQNRARQAIILMRLDLDGPPHSNPDALPSIGNYPWLEPYKGKTVPCPHLHRYVENFGDKWAIPAPIDRYPNVQDLYSTLEAFMVHCNITEPPRIEKGLFS